VILVYTGIRNKTAVATDCHHKCKTVTFHSFYSLSVQIPTTSSIPMFHVQIMQQVFSILRTVSYCHVQNKYNEFFVVYLYAAVVVCDSEASNSTSDLSGIRPTNDLHSHILRSHVLAVCRVSTQLVISKARFPLPELTA